MLQGKYCVGRWVGHYLHDKKARRYFSTRLNPRNLSMAGIFRRDTRICGELGWFILVESKVNLGLVY